LHFCSVAQDAGGGGAGAGTTALLNRSSTLRSASTRPLPTAPPLASVTLKLPSAACATRTVSAVEAGIEPPPPTRVFASQSPERSQRPARALPQKASATARMAERSTMIAVKALPNKRHRGCLLGDAEGQRRPEGGGAEHGRERRRNARSGRPERLAARGAGRRWSKLLTRIDRFLSRVAKRSSRKDTARATIPAP